jgi:phosphomevalonate kinase
VVTVKFVLSFEGSDYSNIENRVDNVINYKEYLRFKNNYFQKIKYERLLTTIVYNTHQVDDDQNIALRSGKQ